MQNNNFGIGRFICEHPFITLFIVGDICGVLKWGMSLNAAKNGVNVSLIDGTNMNKKRSEETVEEEETEAEEETESE